MLGKLIKHDFKSTGKVLVPVYLLLVAITLLGSILLGTRLLQRTELLPLTISLLIAYVLMIFTISMVTCIYLIVHFYRTLFSAQGYLTFTLPASPWSLLFSKALTGCVWYLVSCLLSLASVFTLVISATGFTGFSQKFTSSFTYYDQSFKYQMTLVELLEDVIGYTPMQFFVIMGLFILTSCFFSVAIGYASVTIGQLYARHKVVGTVIAFVSLYFIIQIIISMVMIVISLRPVINMTINADANYAQVCSFMRSIYEPMFPCFIIFYLLFGIGCYITSGIIMNRKVNLD